MSSSFLPAGFRLGRFKRADLHELVGEPQRREHQRLVDDLDGGQMLHVAHDELGDPGAARLANRLAQQPVGDVAALPRRQVVGLVEISGRRSRLP